MVVLRHPSSPQGGTNLSWSGHFIASGFSARLPAGRSGAAAQRPPSEWFALPGPGKDRVFKVHLLNTEFVAVGCGWKPKSGAIQDLDERDAGMTRPVILFVLVASKSSRCHLLGALALLREPGWLLLPRRPRAAGHSVRGREGLHLLWVWSRPQSVWHQSGLVGVRRPSFGDGVCSRASTPAFFSFGLNCGLKRTGAIGPERGGSKGTGSRNE